MNSLQTALLVCNMLQATNMAFNFALYCCVNSGFRRTLNSLVNKLLRNATKIGMPVVEVSLTERSRRRQTASVLLNESGDTV